MENAKKDEEEEDHPPPSSPSTSSEEEEDQSAPIVEVPNKVIFKLEVCVNTVQFLEKMMSHQNQGSSCTTIPIIVTGEALLSAIKKEEEGGGGKRKIKGKNKVEKMKKPKRLSKKFYKVEKILGKKAFGNGRLQYLVRWQGFNEEHDSWESVSHMNCPTLIEAYEKSLSGGETSLEEVIGVSSVATEEPLTQEGMEEDKNEEEERGGFVTRPLTRADMFAETVKLFFQRT